MADDLRLARARSTRWLPRRRPRLIADAARFVEDAGFALLFPNDRMAAPSLWEAVAGGDRVPFADGMGEAESTVWTWKDALPEAGLAWYGTFLYGRASLLSPRLLAALYPGDGEPDDHRALPLSPDAHRIAEALLGGTLTSSALRELIGQRGRYDRAAKALQRQLLTTSAGVREQRTGWPAGVVDLTCRRFTVGTGHDEGYATERFLSTMVETVPGQLARAFGWPAATARARLDGLVAAGLADSSGGGYRTTA